VLFFTDAELPMTGSNKIQRGKLKELVQKRLAG
jgi:acyl-coenzyme A synthetase/AMP-(fatty) acid ligase